MNKFEIFVDSTSDMFTELRRQYDIDYVAMNIVVKGEEKKASLDWDLYSPQEFYGWMREGIKITTTLVPLETFINKWTEVLEKGEDVLYISCSSALSGSVNVGRNAKDMLLEKYPDRKIEIIDPLNSCKGQALMAIKASNLRKEGKELSEIVEIIEKEKLCYNQFCTVATLDYLKRAGRIKAGKAFFGNIFGVKPIIISDAKGNNYAWKKAKGRRQSLLDLVEYTKENIVDPENQTVFVVHADCIEDAEFLKEHIVNEIHPKEVVIDYLGPIIGSTTGPGTVATFFFGKEVTIVGEA
ncbi:MAG: DegV family protein [Acholeplasmatales bacterium]|nr:DegV family protein [Acholeplasmatales bacterium]